MEKLPFMLILLGLFLDLVVWSSGEGPSCAFVFAETPRKNTARYQCRGS